jgi:hypothetical protein
LILWDLCFNLFWVLVFDWHPLYGEAPPLDWNRETEIFEEIGLKAIVLSTRGWIV